MAGRLRRADPWRDTDVIDERAPRFNQAVVAVVAAAGVGFGWPLAWALMGAQLVIGLLLGRRWCIQCLAYYLLVQPRIGEGRLEDSRPPRLANAIGAAFLLGAATAWWLGVPALGTALGAIVAALATLAATTGFCAGCEIYRLAARIRGISPRHLSRVDRDDFPGLSANGDSAYLAFTHPLCSECREWEERLAAESLTTIDVRAHEDLARKYGIAIVPTVIAVDGEGHVRERLAP
jgi:Domain of unknown function (DUF4395)